MAGPRRELSGLLAIAQRDVTKLLRDRPRLAVNLAFPVLLIGGLGVILQPTVGRATGLSAVTLAFTGVLAASLFQSAAAGMISIVEDRENDFSRGQALALGLVEEVAMDVVPVVFGSGKRYFGSVDAQHLLEDPHTVIRGDRVLHLLYRVRR